MTEPRPNASAPPAPFALCDLNPRREPVLDFPDRAFGELAPDDYRALGFLCGLEVHQQLATRRKLFCRCPSGRRTTVVDAVVLRHMRPTLSEMGEYDACALMEFKTRKEIVYQLERSSVCTYEIDDTPPFEIDEEAVRIALAVARAFDLQPVSELHVMRKQYLDGSIPTGFQRTAMIGVGGSVPLVGSELGAGRALRIRQLSLEEDSCREVSDVGHRITFRTDRLGTPLIETVTEPDLLTPNDVALGGALLAQVARASGRVRRGAGAARQDVNVSIAGSRRIEIKGVGRHAVLPRLVHTEAYRQLALLRLAAELSERGVDDSMLTLDARAPAWSSPLYVDAWPILRGCEHPTVRAALERGDALAAVRVRGFCGLLARPTQPGLAFEDELADRARVIACLTARPCLLSSDGAPDALDGARWALLRDALSAERDDAIVLLWGPARDLDTAAREVLARCREALAGVPSETRQARVDGTTGFERLLPGPERMYPDTDTPPLPIPDAWLDSIEIALPEPPWERVVRYRDLGLGEAAARRLAASDWADLFDALAPGTRACARRLAAALEKRLVHRWRETGCRELPAAGRLAPLVAAVDDGRVRPEAFERAFDRLLRESLAKPDAVVDAFARTGAEESELEDAVATVAARAGAPAKGGAELLEWALGRVLPALSWRVAPAHARRELVLALGLGEEPAKVEAVP